jgi:hypothetical protein
MGGKDATAEPILPAPFHKGHGTAAHSCPKGMRRRTFSYITPTTSRQQEYGDSARNPKGLSLLEALNFWRLQELINQEEALSFSAGRMCRIDTAR